MRVWYNSSLESKNYIVPGLIAVIMMIIAAQLTSLTIAREWEMGTMEQVLSTPLRPAEMVLGKMLAYFAGGAGGRRHRGRGGASRLPVPFRGSFLVLAVSTCVVSLVRAVHRHLGFGRTRDRRCRLTRSGS